MPPKNIHSKKIPRSFRELPGWKVQMVRPFQPTRMLTWWEHVQYMFGKRWFK